MADIRDYPNPLLQAFSDLYGLAVVFDANGVPSFNGNKVTRAQFDAFLTEAMASDRNFYRLLPDGTVVRPTFKVFYDGRTGGVFNSILANDFVERAGGTAVSLDKTKLGQFFFRSKIEDAGNYGAGITVTNYGGRITVTVLTVTEIR